MRIDRIICIDNPIFNLALFLARFTESKKSFLNQKSILNSIKEFSLVEIIVESDFQFGFIGIDNNSNTGTIGRNVKSFDKIPHPTLIRVPFEGPDLEYRSGPRCTMVLGPFTLYFRLVGRILLKQDGGFH